MAYKDFSDPYPDENSDADEVVTVAKANDDLLMGYRELSEGEKLAINNIKQLAQLAGVMVETLEVNDSLDQRWVAIAKTELQKGFMSMTRAVAQPTTF